MADNVCGACGFAEGDHGTMNHEFTLENELIPKKTETPPPPAREGVVVNNFGLPGGDPVLRMVLVQKGLVLPSELEDTEAILRSTGVLRHDRPS